MDILDIIIEHTAIFQHSLLLHQWSFSTGEQGHISQHCFCCAASVQPLSHILWAVQRIWQCSFSERGDCLCYTQTWELLWRSSTSNMALLVWDLWMWYFSISWSWFKPLSGSLGQEVKRLTASISMACLGYKKQEVLSLRCCFCKKMLTHIH